MVDSREFQGVESACISRLTHAPSQPVIVSSPCGIIVSRPCGIAAIIASDLIRETNSLHQETFFENSFAPVESATSIPKGLLHGRNPILSFEGSVFSSTGKPAARSEDVNKDVVNLVFSISRRRSSSANLYSSSSKTPDLRPACREIPFTFHVFVLEDKIQNRSMCLFQITLGSNVTDEGSGDG